MSTTLVGIFDDYNQAQQAVSALSQAGIRQGDISIARNDSGNGYTTYGGANSNDYTTGTSIGDGISNFFDSIFGTDINDDQRGIYSESVRRGSTVIIVNTDEQMTDRAADILNQNGAADVDRRASQYRASGYNQYDEKAPLYTADQTREEHQTYANQGEVALPIIEEQLKIGKRTVETGGARVHTNVTERPVEETVSLREENITVERRPVDRPVGNAPNAFQEGVIEVTEMAEVPVVSKQARVVEEVVVGKEITERQETVTETVKRTEVDVDKLNRTDVSRADANRTAASLTDVDDSARNNG